MLPGEWTRRSAVQVVSPLRLDAGTVVDRLAESVQHAPNQSGPHRHPACVPPGQYAVA